MNKNEAKFEPIKINIKDPKLFADVAIAIDSPFFIKRAKAIRIKFGITKSLGKDDCYLWAVKNKDKKTSKKIFGEIDEIRADMNLTVNYGLVFAKAVFGCHVHKFDYESTYLINFQSPPKYFYYSLPKSELYALVLTPQSRKKDIDRLYAEYQKIMKKLIKGRIFDSFDFGKGKIEQTREWYWIRYGDVLSGKSEKPKTYPKTLEEWRKKCPKQEEHDTDEEYKECPHCSIVDWNIIEKLVPLYVERLKNPEG